MRKLTLFVAATFALTAACAGDETTTPPTEEPTADVISDDDTTITPDDTTTTPDDTSTPPDDSTPPPDDSTPPPDDSTPPPDDTTECVPACDGKVCGDDGCGGDCGICDDGIECTVDSCSDDGASCLADDSGCGDCEPACEGKICGDDGCGGDCGACDDGIECTVDTCTEDGAACEANTDACECTDSDQCPGELVYCQTPGCLADLTCGWIASEDGTLCSPDTGSDICHAGECIAVPVCGDGEAEGAEACDDGNTDGDDYCAADCAEVTGSCGDETVQDNEACDDGNTEDDDYCSADCSTVTGSCGDGVAQGNEGCDDGNLVPGDSCTAACTVENFQVGDIIVSEVMASPAGYDDEREWFELYNTTDTDIDINGWRLSDSNADLKWKEVSGSCDGLETGAACGTGGACQEGDGGPCVLTCDAGCGADGYCWEVPPVPDGSGPLSYCAQLCTDDATACGDGSTCVVGPTGVGFCSTGIHRITSDVPVVVAAKGYLVMTLVCDPAINGGLDPGYCYETTLGPFNPQFVLNNDGDNLYVEWHHTVIDQVFWDDGDISQGSSWSLSSDALDHTSNDDGTKWCDGTGVYYSDESTQELGTPGAANGVCQ